MAAIKLACLRTPLIASVLQNASSSLCDSQKNELIRVDTTHAVQSMAKRNGPSSRTSPARL